MLVFVLDEFNKRFKVNLPELETALKLPNLEEKFNRSGCGWIRLRLIREDYKTYLEWFDVTYDMGIAYYWNRPRRSTEKYSPDPLYFNPDQEMLNSNKIFHQKLSQELEENADKAWEALVQGVKTRGPDAQNSLQRRIVVTVGQEESEFEIRFHGSVLHMRGDVVAPQPFVNDAGDVFLWNGEIFDGFEVNPHENDGSKLFQNITETCAQMGLNSFPGCIREVEGPYAFIYYQAASQKLFYGRDGLGRRSLLVNEPNDNSPFCVISSCSPTAANTEKDDWREVGAEAVWELDLKLFASADSSHGLHFNDSIASHPRYNAASAPSANSLIYKFSRLNANLPAAADIDEMGNTPPIPQKVITAFISVLEKAVRARVLHLPQLPAESARLEPDSKRAKVAVLFSGGIDCTLIALLVNRILPLNESIDLLNVSFENPRNLRGDLKPVGKKTKKRETAKAKNLETAEEHVNGDNEQMKSAMAAEQDTGQSQPSIYDVPDRITGKASAAELRRICPDRNWNFVEVNVPYLEMLQYRQTVIDLMKPQRTVMDLSIAIAFYFAARGQGRTNKPGQIEPSSYTSTARVLLSGLGADELLAGYARHRRAFNTPKNTDELGGNGENHAALIAELQMDLDRLPTRNLGRDDRIISFHSKEARYPFLSASVIDFCTRLPVWYKCRLDLAEGHGDKLLLRLAAAQLGLGQIVSGLKKRAIHFGARTAKMEIGTGKSKGESLLY